MSYGPEIDARFDAELAAYLAAETIRLAAFVPKPKAIAKAVRELNEALPKLAANDTFFVRLSTGTLAERYAARNYSGDRIDTIAFREVGRAFAALLRAEGFNARVRNLNARSDTGTVLGPDYDPRVLGTGEGKERLIKDEAETVAAILYRNGFGTFSPLSEYRRGGYGTGIAYPGLILLETNFDVPRSEYNSYLDETNTVRVRKVTPEEETIRDANKAEGKRIARTAPAGYLSPERDRYSY
jgi:hypothetical protein